MLLKPSSKYYVLLVIPDLDNYGLATSITIADYKINNIQSQEIQNDQENQEIIIPSEKSAIIYLDNDSYDDRSHLEFYNILSVYSSSSQNMRYIYSSDLNKKYNFLFHNYIHIPMFIDKISKEQKINIKTYYPRFSFFAAVDSEVFRTYFNAYNNLFKYNFNLDFGLTELLPINVRINSDTSTFYEFFNLYFNKFEDNINLYINKLYGETNLYECSDELNLSDLSVLQKPINQCKNKKSIFNRLFTFKGTKTLSGYLTPNSYFDVYLEFNNDSNKIKISKLLEGTINSASKYIKKEKEYTVDFIVDHMVKIEVVDNVEVTIYNGKNTVTLNSKNPAAKIEGSNYKVKTNSDTMIYFYGKLFEFIQQKELFPNMIGNFAALTSNRRVYYLIDSGFEGYNPLNVEIFMDSSIRYDENNYVENIYEKMKNKLVENEKIFLYFFDEDKFDSGEEEIEQLQINIT